MVKHIDIEGNEWIDFATGIRLIKCWAQSSKSKESCKVQMGYVIHFI